MKLKQIIVEKITPEELANSKQMDQATDLVFKNCKPFLNKINYDVKKYPLFRGYKPKEKNLEKFNNALMIKKQTRKNRRPVDTDNTITKRMDELFQKYHKYPFRSQAMFATGDYGQAADYGKIFLVFPIGQFNFLWDKLDSDMFEGTLYTLLDDYHSEDISNELRDIKQEIQHLRKQLKQVQQKKAKLESKAERTTNNEKRYAIDDELYDLQDMEDELERDIENHVEEYDAIQWEHKDKGTRLINHVKKNMSTKNLTEAIGSNHEIMVACDYYYMVQYHDERLHVDDPQDMEQMFVAGQTFLDQLDKKIKERKK